MDTGEVHAPWLDLLSEQPGLACDIGAGSGRDAAWLARRGWDVTAVEPCAELRELGETFTRSVSVANGGATWLDDALPELKRLRALDQRYQLILVSAVWMHLPPPQRERAMRIVSELLAPGGLLVLTIRNGPDKERRFYPLKADELVQQAINRALVPVRRDHKPDSYRKDISWDYLVFKLPDDGTGSLPLLRHIIVNDNKSASYKLGLLRTLIHIADSCPGMVTRRTDEYVDIPFGLVGLYWLKIYMPLVLRHNLLQAPSADHEGQKGYGWAGPDFWTLKNWSPYDLRLGATFGADDALRLTKAIRQVCNNVLKMPANYIRWPGQNRQVFECETTSFRRKPARWQITRESLQSFGTFRIPVSIWQSFSQYACWLEPAILNEWVRLMQSWDYHYDLSVYDTALQWDEGRRDTGDVQKRIKRLRDQGQRLECVWTRVRLNDRNCAVDHCFPWSRWFNNDLWNLLPATRAANIAKSDRLPAASLLLQAREDILQWWNMAYLDDASLNQQFFIEAEAALPLLDSNQRDPLQVFHALQHQRSRLRANQQLPEWLPRRDFQALDD